MRLVEMIRGMFRRRPLSPEELASQQEAKVVHEQMLQDRLSQRGGQNYRAGGR